MNEDPEANEELDESKVKCPACGEFVDELVEAYFGGLDVCLKCAQDYKGRP